jgi:hypothetical protein
MKKTIENISKMHDAGFLWRRCCYTFLKKSMHYFFCYFATRHVTLRIIKDGIEKYKSCVSWWARVCR